VIHRRPTQRTAELDDDYPEEDKAVRAMYAVYAVIIHGALLLTR
jgi:hypothetical protein